MDNAERNLCPTTFKNIHSNSADATVELRRAVSRGQKNLEVFRCDSCHGWHVGHEKKKRKRIKVRR